MENITWHILVETKTSEFKTETIDDEEHAKLVFESLKTAFGDDNVYAIETRSRFTTAENDAAF